MKIATVISNFIALILLSHVVLANPSSSSWIQITSPRERQTSQVEAGYPMGCEITSIFYALKFGPTEWQAAYKNIPGTTDLQKIKSLGAKFNSMPSKFSNGQPAFSEKYGMNPNDVAWMISMLSPNSASLKMANYFAHSQAVLSEKNQLLKNFQSDIVQSLEKGKPIIMDLYFSNPKYSHAVLVTGIRNSIATNSTTAVKILDPMTGEFSEAAISVELVNFGDSVLIGIVFYGSQVVDSKGTILSIHI